MRPDLDLFEKNKSFLLSLNPNFFETHSIDFEASLAKSTFSSFSEEKSYWTSFPNKTIHYQNQLFRDHKTLDFVKEKLGDLPSSTVIEDFINIDIDVQYWDFLLSLREILLDLGIDPEVTVTTLGTGGTSVIALGTGSGEFLLRMLRETKPYSFHVLLTDWHDFFSSFYHIDWSDLSAQLASENVKFSVTCVANLDDFLAKLRQNGLFYLDHSYVFCSPSTDSKLVEFSQELNGSTLRNWIRYLGYTLDEYNMIVQAADTLQREPKCYFKPPKPLKGKFVVCGSGPSLDYSINELKRLQQSHLIVCGGSSYKALVEAGIRVDFLTLMERDYDIGNDDYSGFHDSIGGAPDSVHLVMAAECYHKMLDTFPKHCTFFRSSLTSANIYASTGRQLIPLEGPEAVNTAVSLCVQLGAQQVLLVGVDLGSTSSDSTRSVHVLGTSNRTFDKTCKGNFSESAYTCDSMINVKYVLEVLAKNVKNKAYFPDDSTKATKLYNASDGVLIDGYEPIKFSEYYLKYDLPDCQTTIPSLDELDISLFDWWNSLDNYTHDDFWAQWESRNPRKNTFNLCRKLEHLINEPIPWLPDFIFKVEELFDLEKPPEHQIPIRIMRGTVMKAVLSITQQLHISRNENPETLHQFLRLSKELLLETLEKLESQIYQIIDYVESTHAK